MLAWLLDAGFERARANAEAIAPSLLNRLRELYLQMGDRRSALLHSSHYCVLLLMYGAYEDACAESEELIEEPTGEAIQIIGYVRSMCIVNRAARVGNFEPFRQLLARAMQQSPRVAAANRVWFALHLFHGGHVDDAATEVADLIEDARSSPPFGTVALAVSARIHLRGGDVARAVALSDEATAAELRGVSFWGKSSVDVSRVEVLEAAGRTEEARAVLVRAVAALLARADAAQRYRRVYLESSLGSAELAAMARARGISVV